jgi:hypothetical protein
MRKHRNLASLVLSTMLLGLTLAPAHATDVPKPKKDERPAPVTWVPAPARASEPPKTNTGGSARREPSLQDPPALPSPAAGGSRQGDSGARTGGQKAPSFHDDHCKGSSNCSVIFDNGAKS